MNSFLLYLVVLVALLQASEAAFVHGPRGGVARGSPAVCSEESLKPARPATALYAVAKKKKSKTKKTKKAKKAAKAETFKKADFVSSIAELTGMNKKDSEMAMQAVLQVIREEVSDGKRVSLPGFGTFALKERAARKGRNPQTGEELDIAASKNPGFTASKTWKDEINGRV